MQASGSLQTLNRSGLPEAAGLLARAFHADPLYRFLVPEPVRRQRWLAVLMRASLQSCLPHVLAVRASGRLVGVAAWQQPGATGRASFLQLLGGWLAVRPSLRAVGRGLRVQALLMRQRPATPHTYLYLLGVSARVRGRGFGLRLLQEVLRRAQERPVVLDTANPDAVPFYVRQGFNLVGRLRAAGGGPALWVMRRPGG